jgi:hypothetical protein
MSAASAQSLNDILDAEKARVEKSNQERREISRNLENIISTAQQLLANLGSGAAPRRRGRPAGLGRKAVKRGPGRPKGSGKKRGKRTMSAAARKAISDAQKKRWAKQKAEKK